jgi:hypothetical protein
VRSHEYERTIKLSALVDDTKHMDNPQQTAPRKDNRLFGQELEKRTLNFGVRIIKLSYRLPRTLEGGVVRAQITKAGTSVGAN